MASGGPDLFVVCKHCGAEVSPYITECPYCGNRLQKRAPKLDRDGRIADTRARRPPTPTLPRLRRGEIPGIRHETHAYVTVAIVALTVVASLLWRSGAVNFFDLVPVGSVGSHWWRVLTAPFVYVNTWYAVITTTVVALFGTLLERRHGPLLVIVLFLGASAASIALGPRGPFELVDGANAGAIALAVAWAIPDLLTLRAGEEVEGDLIGAGVLAAVIALMPLVAPEAGWVSDGVGVAAGLLLGFPVARLRPV